MRPLSECNPIVTAVYFLAVTLITMFTMNPVILGISFVCAVVFFCLNSPKRGFKQHALFRGLGLILALINPLVYHNGVTVLFVLDDNPVTLEALIYGIVSSVKIIGTLYWFRSFSLIMTEDKLLYCLGSLSPKTAQVLSMALRYVPMFRDQIKKVHLAQKGIGLYKEDNMIDDVRGGLRIFSIIVTWALENGIITADSMAARGYGTGRRTYFSLFRFTKYDGWLVLVIVLLSAVPAVLLILKNAEVVYYPVLTFPANSWVTMLIYVCFALLALLPEALFLEDRLSWKYYLSKM